jgi:hypothetical protein
LALGKAHLEGVEAAFGHGRHVVENLRVENNHSLFDWRRETKGILFFIPVKPDFSRSFPFS